MSLSLESPLFEVFADANADLLSFEFVVRQLDRYRTLGIGNVINSRLQLVV